MDDEQKYQDNVVFSAADPSIFGNAVQRFKDDHPNLILKHPVLVGLAGTGAAAETAHAGGKVLSLLWHHKLMGAGAGTVAVGVANERIKDALELRGCTNNHPPFWKCEGVHGQHILDIEAKDYYIIRGKHGKALADSLEADGEPAKDGCVPHHIWVTEEFKSAVESAGLTGFKFDFLGET